MEEAFVCASLLKDLAWAGCEGASSLVASPLFMASAGTGGVDEKTQTGVRTRAHS